MVLPSTTEKIVFGPNLLREIRKAYANRHGKAVPLFLLRVCWQNKKSSLSAANWS
jgi:hypothetical protein